jgi:hypothetical protein
MIARLKFATLAVLLSLSLSGCCCNGGRGPTELFSGIDRHCFVADWMNDHGSCVSCGYCANGCSQPTLPLHSEPLVLPSEPEPTVQ